MKFAAIINPMSRTVPADAADALEAALREEGHELVSLGCDTENLLSDVEAAASSGADAVIAWGGDGTLACTLNACGPEGPPVLILPGGTMNMLPHRLHGTDDTWREILDKVLADPQADTIPAGEAAGQRFYIAALFGRMTAFAGSREAVRKGALLEAAQALVQGNVLDVETRLRISSRHLSGEQLTSAVAAAVVVSAKRKPSFELAAIDPETTLDLLSTAIDTMMHGWKEAEQVEHDTSHAITVHDLDGKEIPATLDGEQVTFDTPVEIRMIEKAARVLRAGADH